MKLMRIWVAGGVLSAATVGGTACVVVSTSHSGPQRPNVLKETTELVIVPAYHDFEEQTSTLSTRVAEFCAMPSEATFASARASWHEANRAWNRTASFRLGPSSAVRTGNIQDWPIVPSSIETSARATEPVTDAWLEALGSRSRGLPVLEYLLSNYDDTTGALTALSGTRRCEYASAVARDLEARAAEIAEGWDPAYAAELSKAGQGSTTWSSESDALSAVLTQIISALETIKLTRLGVPLGIDDGSPDPAAVESPYERASIDAMVATVEGVRKLWLAEGGLDSFAIWLRERNPELATRVLRELDDALEALREIPEPLSTYVAGADLAQGMNAHMAIRSLERTFASDVSAAISISVGFTDKDGD
jgi:uncharacterized protein